MLTEDKSKIPSPEVIKKLAETMADYREDFIRDLCDQIEIPSVMGEPAPDAPYGEGPGKALNLFLEQGKRLGFDTVNVDNHAGYVEIGSGDEMVAALCHVDVVPAGAGWERDPYTPVIEDGKIYGRGTSDDKGPAIAILYALKALQDDPDFSPSRRIRLIVGANEENGSECMVYYREHEEIPVSGFTADASFPAVYAEKGIARLKLTWTRNGTEPLLAAEGGEAVNMVPGSCLIKFKNSEGEIIEKEIMGTTAHASRPFLGDNAISKAVAELADLSSEDPFINFYQNYIGFETDGSLLGLAFTDESGDTTVNAGLLKIDENAAQLNLDIRYPVTMDFDNALKALQDKFVPEGIEIELADAQAPLNLGKNSHLISTLMQVYSDNTGLEAEAVAMGGGTYARSIPNICAFGMLFPGDPDLAHQINEYIEIDKTLAAAAIYRDSLRLLAE
ncbi:MAG TPA: M20 family metallopeptidase [Clostridiaceae bacterium]|nr:M20 family metallopeptidase [Clostridiaceae bacterium]